MSLWEQTFHYLLCLKRTLRTKQYLYCSCEVSNTRHVAERYLCKDYLLYPTFNSFFVYVKKKGKHAMVSMDGYSVGIQPTSCLCNLLTWKKTYSIARYNNVGVINIQAIITNWEHLHTTLLIFIYLIIIFCI
jgi:hypothetical protein